MPSEKQGPSSSEDRKLSELETPLTSRKEHGIVVKSVALTSAKFRLSCLPDEGLQVSDLTSCTIAFSSMTREK